MSIENENKENLVEDTKEEIQVKEEVQATDKKEAEEKSVKEKSDKKGIRFLDSLISIVVDQVAVLGISTAILYIVDFIMRGVLGYYITEKLSMLFIIYVIANIIYNVALETSKFEGTLGKVITNLKVSKLK